MNIMEPNEQILARLDRERAELVAAIESERATERPAALATVRELIVKHSITRTELAEMVRVREFAPRPNAKGPRKAKAASNGAAHGLAPAAATNAATGPQ